MGTEREGWTSKSGKRDSATASTGFPSASPLQKSPGLFMLLPDNVQYE